MDLRHAVRIGADQRPQCFPVLRQRPVCRNDLLLRRQQLGTGIGDIHAILNAALGTVLMGLHRDGQSLPADSTTSSSGRWPAWQSTAAPRCWRDPARFPPFPPDAHFSRQWRRQRGRDRHPINQYSAWHRRRRCSGCTTDRFIDRERVRVGPGELLVGNPRRFWAATAVAWTPIADCASSTVDCDCAIRSRAACMVGEFCSARLTSILSWAS